MSTNDSSHDSMYRVSVDSYKKHVEVQCIGLFCVDSGLDGFYSGLEELPQWMQEKVALLMMTSSTPPTVDVEMVGRRINQNTFWVYV